MPYPPCMPCILPSIDGEKGSTTDTLSGSGCVAGAAPCHLPPGSPDTTLTPVQNHPGSKLCRPGPIHAPTANSSTREKGTATGGNGPHSPSAGHCCCSAYRGPGESCSPMFSVSTEGGRTLGVLLPLGVSSWRLRGPVSTQQAHAQPGSRGQ